MQLRLLRGIAEVTIKGSGLGGDRYAPNNYYKLSRGELTWPNLGTQDQIGLEVFYFF